MKEKITVFINEIKFFLIGNPIVFILGILAASFITVLLIIAGQ